jgi:hypothetical protein
MTARKVIRKKIRHRGKGTSVDADINAVIATNVGEENSRTHVRSKQRIVQRSGRKKDQPDQGRG